MNKVSFTERKQRMRCKQYYSNKRIVYTLSQKTRDSINVGNFAKN